MNTDLKRRLKQEVLDSFELSLKPKFGFHYFLPLCTSLALVFVLSVRVNGIDQTFKDIGQGTAWSIQKMSEFLN